MGSCRHRRPSSARVCDSSGVWRSLRQLQRRCDSGQAGAAICVRVVGVPPCWEHLPRGIVGGRLRRGRAPLPRRGFGRGALRVCSRVSEPRGVGPSRRAPHERVLATTTAAALAPRRAATDSAARREHRGRDGPRRLMTPQPGVARRAAPAPATALRAERAPATSREATATAPAEPARRRRTGDGRPPDAPAAPRERGWTARRGRHAPPCRP